MASSPIWWRRPTSGAARPNARRATTLNEIAPVGLHGHEANSPRAGGRLRAARSRSALANEGKLAICALGRGSTVAVMRAPAGGDGVMGVADDQPLQMGPHSAGAHGDWLPANSYRIC
jgi:hypothetical protein